MKVTIELEVSNNFGAVTPADLFNEINRMFQNEMALKQQLYDYIIARRLFNDYQEYNTLNSVQYNKTVNNHE